MEHGQEEAAEDQEQWVLVLVHRQLLRRVPLLLASQLKLITDQPTGESVIALLQVRSYRGLQISFMCFANLASLISLVSFGKATSTRTRTPQNNKCNKVNKNNGPLRHALSSHVLPNFFAVFAVLFL